MRGGYCPDARAERFQLRQPELSMISIGRDSILHCLSSLNEFGAYCVPCSSQHRPAAQAILSGGVWEPKTIELIAGCCRGGDVIHAGAYFGDFLPAIASACDPLSKVWAFEPNPENFRCASITVLLNNLVNVELLNAGVGAQRGKLPMMIADHHNTPLGGASRIISAEQQTNGAGIVRVDIVKIDDVIPSDRWVSVLHLDVEGFEQQALTGALATINRCQPFLILEDLPEPEWLAQNIMPLGYEIVGTVHDNTVLMIPSTAN
jgi:FkbM family methyltransferase